MSDQAPLADRGLPAEARDNPGLDETTRRTLLTGGLTGGGVLGALAVSSCCILPLVLFSLGMTGTWLGTLTALYPYKWFFFAPAAGFIAGGFYLVYRKPKAGLCEDGASCAPLASDRINKLALWSSTVLVLAALAFPYAAPALLGVE